MAKIICTQTEYDKLITVLGDNSQFLADVRVIYDIVKEAPTVPKDYVYDTDTDEFLVYRNKYTGREIHIVKDPDVYLLKPTKPAWQIDTRVIDIKETVADILDYYGLNDQGDRIHKSKGWECYTVSDVSLNQAKSIKRAVDKLMNPHDQFCEMKYDKSTRCAKYDIVS